MGTIDINNVVYLSIYIGFKGPGITISHSKCISSDYKGASTHFSSLHFDSVEGESTKVVNLVLVKYTSHF